jgi:hypothetical protein
VSKDDRPKTALDDLTNSVLLVALGASVLLAVAWLLGASTTVLVAIAMAPVLGGLALQVAYWVWPKRDPFEGMTEVQATVETFGPEDDVTLVYKYDAEGQLTSAEVIRNEVADEATRQESTVGAGSDQT